MQILQICDYSAPALIRYFDFAWMHTFRVGELAIEKKNVSFNWKSKKIVNVAKNRFLHKNVGNLDFIRRFKK